MNQSAKSNKTVSQPQHPNFNEQLGVHIQQHQLTIALQDDNMLTNIKYLTYPLPLSEHHQTQLRHHCCQKRVIFGIPVQESHIFSLPLSNLLTDAQAMTHIKSQGEHQFHFKPSEFYYDYRRNKHITTKQNALVIACQKTKLKKQLSLLKHCQLKPQVVDHYLCAIHRVLRIQQQPDTLIFYHTSNKMIVALSATHHLGPVITIDHKHPAQHQGMLIPWLHQLDQKPLYKISICENDNQQNSIPESYYQAFGKQLKEVPIESTNKVIAHGLALWGHCDVN